ASGALSARPERSAPNSCAPGRVGTTDSASVGVGTKADEPRPAVRRILLARRSLLRRCHMATTEGRVLTSAKRFTGWYIVAAILFIILGAFAIIEPAVAGLGVTLLVGWLLIFGGIAYFIGAFYGGGAKSVIFHILAGIVFVLGGLYFITHPLMGLGTLTLFLASVI